MPNDNPSIHEMETQIREKIEAEKAEKDRERRIAMSLRLLARNGALMIDRDKNVYVIDPQWASIVTDEGGHIPDLVEGTVCRLTARYSDQFDVGLTVRIENPEGAECDEGETWVTTVNGFGRFIARIDDLAPIV